MQTWQRLNGEQLGNTRMLQKLYMKREGNPAGKEGRVCSLITRTSYFLVCSCARCFQRPHITVFGNSTPYDSTVKRRQC